MKTYHALTLGGYTIIYSKSAVPCNEEPGEMVEIVLASHFLPGLGFKGRLPDIKIVKPTENEALKEFQEQVLAAMEERGLI